MPGGSIVAGRGGWWDARSFSAVAGGGVVAGGLRAGRAVIPRRDGGRRSRGRRRACGRSLEQTEARAVLAVFLADDADDRRAVAAQGVWGLLPFPPIQSDS